MSIGNALAEARRQSGLTITEVSQRTCIRETIIRGIERSDFSACGGDFYARGHIRSIARAVGTDPEPIIREYDATLGPPRTISAADVFHPVTPIKIRERRRPNWTAAMTAALVLAAGLFTYQHFTAGSATTTPRAALARPQGAVPSTRQPVKTQRAVHHRPRKLNIRLAASRDCWIQLRTTTGRTIFSGTVYAGSTMNWTERHPVSMIIGNPAGIRLRVNGKNPVPPGTAGSVTLSLRVGAGRHQPASGG